MNPFEFLKNVLTPQAPTELPENALLIDVRSPVEFSGGSIHGAINIPVNQIELISAHKPKLDLNRPIVVFCASGMRSAQAKQQLHSLGYDQVINGGGISSLAMQLAQSQKT